MSACARDSGATAELLHGSHHPGATIPSSGALSQWEIWKETSRPCKLLVGHNKERWPCTGTSVGDRELDWGSTGPVLGTVLGQCRVCAGAVLGECRVRAGAVLGSKLGDCTGGAQGHVGRLYWWSTGPCCRAPGTVVRAALATEVTPLVLGKEKRWPWAQLLPSSGRS